MKSASDQNEVPGPDGGGNMRGDTNARFKRVDAAMKQGSFNQAQDEIRQILDQDPANLGGLELLAKVQWNLSEHERLLETLASLLKVNPYEPGYHILKGNALRSLGRYGDAHRAFVRAGSALGAHEALQEVSAIQADLVLALLRYDPVFKAHYAQDPERACNARGFEFGCEIQVRHSILRNEYPSSRVHQRPS